MANTNREGIFGDPWHIIDVNQTMSATLWQKEYNGEKVELQHVVVRVLSIVAASSGICEKNWSSFDFVHTKKMKLKMRKNGIINRRHFFIKRSCLESQCLEIS